MSETRRVADIVVKERARSGLGDTLSLESSIRRMGLLHPVVINTRNELIVGGRRLQAVKNLFWKEVPVRVVASLDDALLALHAEREENTEREPLSPADMARLVKVLFPLEKKEAKARQGKRTDLQPPGNFPGGSFGESRDKVAEFVGVSGRTLAKVIETQKIIDAAPEENADLAERMAQPGAKVDPIYHEAKRREEGPKPPPRAAPTPPEPASLVAPPPQQIEPPPAEELTAQKWRKLIEKPADDLAPLADQAKRLLRAPKGARDTAKVKELANRLRMVAYALAPPPTPPRDPLGRIKARHDIQEGDDRDAFMTRACEMPEHDRRTLLDELLLLLEWWGWTWPEEVEAAKTGLMTARVLDAIEDAQERELRRQARLERRHTRRLERRRLKAIERRKAGLRD